MYDFMRWLGVELLARVALHEGLGEFTVELARRAGRGERGDQAVDEVIKALDMSVLDDVRRRVREMVGRVSGATRCTPLRGFTMEVVTPKHGPEGADAVSGDEEGER